MLNILSLPPCRIRFKHRDSLSWKEQVIESVTGYLTLSGRVAAVYGKGKDTNTYKLCLKEESEDNFRAVWILLRVVSYVTIIFPLLAWIALAVASYKSKFCIRKTYFCRLPQQADFSYIELIWAIRHNQQQKGCSIIQGMSQEQLSLEGNRALTDSLIFQTKKISQALIQRISPPNLSIQNCTGSTVLMKAIAWNQREGFEDLLQKIAPDQLALSDNWGNTALMEAIKFNRQEFATVLIQKMNPQHLALRNIHGETALMIGIDFKCSEEIIQALIQRMTLEQLSLQDETGTTALSRAVQKDQRSIAKAIQNKLSCGTLAIGCIQPNPDSPLYRSFERSSLREPRALALVREFL